MKANLQRIWAVIGRVLIIASILLMLVGLFAGAAKALLLNISLFCFLGAVAVLLTLSAARKKAPDADSTKEE